MIILHHCPQSRSMRTLWLLHELDISFDVRTYPFDKTLRRPEFLELSPAGRVPALQIDGLQMFETGAITQYLCEQFSPDVLGRPVGHKDRADWLIWVHFAETISQHVAALTQQHIALYDDAMRSPIVMRLEAARIGKCYDALEARLTDHGFLVGDAFTAADVSVGQAVAMAKLFHVLDEHPCLANWFARISARPAYQKSLPAPGEELYSKPFYPAWPTE
ncbi:MAG: glutathione S-transferase family protein [Paracoccaceae bacterium]